MRRIASRQNACVARFKAAARRDSDSVILLDGAHLVADALAAGTRVREAAIAIDAESDPETSALAVRLVAAGCDVVSATAPVMAALSPVRSSSAIVAIADRPARAVDLHAPAALIVVAVDVQDPGNVGAIVRVAEAGGATGVIVAGQSADPFGWKALRGSMGSALRLPVTVARGPLSIAALRNAGCRVVATAPRGGASFFSATWQRPAALIIGGEGQGLSAAQIAQADEVITIPMRPPVESLNAAVTAALMVYEATRQRT